MNDADKLLADNPNVVDGEIVKPSKPSKQDDSVAVLLNLEQLIKTHITRIDNLKVERKKQKEMIDDILINDETYKQHNDKAKETAKIKAATKAQILLRPNVSSVADKLKNLKTEAKELEMALSDYLCEYERISGSNEVKGEDGEVREIVYVAKLVKKSTHKR